MSDDNDIENRIASVGVYD